MGVFSKQKLPDLAVNVLAFILAGSCSYFAGHMILRLQGMENPPPDMGLNFPPPKKKSIIDEPVLVDPRETGAIDPAASDRRGSVAQPYTKDSPVLERHLLMVIDDIAFVEVTRLAGKNIMPLGVGSELPGAGTIERIEKVNGRWRLIAAGEILQAESR